MLTKCQGYLIFNWETLILVNVLKDQELAVPTSAFISTDILEAVYEKKSDVICSSFPPRCDTSTNPRPPYDTTSLSPKDLCGALISASVLAIQYYAVLKWVVACYG